MRIDICSGWEFRKRSASRAWLAGTPGKSNGVALPHCWNTQDTYHKGTDYFRGQGAYRREFASPSESHAACFFETEGFYGTGDVWLNGRRLATIDGQYLGVCVELTPHLVPGGQTNVLAVRLTNRCPNHVLPGIKDPDFILYGGLSGRAWLRLRPDLHMVDGDTSVRCKNPLADSPTLSIEARIRNGSATMRSGQLHWRLLDGDGNCVASAAPAPVTLEGTQTITTTTTLTVSKPSLWSVDAPYRYRLVGSLEDSDGAIDAQDISYGFRHAEFRPRDGFYLNGSRLALRGCNRHESMPGFGRALPVALCALDAQIIKDHGLNFVRLSHYPQHPAFLDACDRLGLLVYAELASWKSVRGYGRWLQAALRQFEGMIRRDRHHPSVILWGMGNEAQSRRAYGKLRDLAKRLDPDRPVTYAENHFYRARRRRTPGVPDVWGINYELDAIPDGLTASRSQCVVVSECSNEPHTRRGDANAEKRQVLTLTRDLSRLDDCAGVAGWVIWCYNDYATLRKGRYRRFSGIVDGWRHPKLAADWLKARYGREPHVHISGDWGRAGPATRSICVLGNGQTIRLTCAGQPLAELDAAKFNEIDIPYRAEPLVAETWHGGYMATDTLFPFGPAHHLMLEIERLNNSDTFAITISVVDTDGHTVTDWKGDVVLEVSEQATLHTLRPDRCVPVAAGRAKTYLTTPGEHGSVTLHAEADGLRAASIDVDLAVSQVCNGEG